MIGEIRMFAGNFSPKNWAYCSGQLMTIAQNTALYSILGTSYGGNGTVTFGLPDLRGRVAVGAGQGQGLSLVNLGELSGQTTTTLTTGNLPPHTHSIVAPTASISGSVSLQMNVNNNTGAQSSPVNNYLGVEQAGGALYNSASSGTDSLNANAITVTATDLKVDLSSLNLASSGAALPYSNMQPYLGIGYIICVYGYYPARN